MEALVGMFYYVYRLTCTHPLFQQGPKYYYGWRSSLVPPEEDTTYWSSSELVKQVRQVLGPDWFQKKIVSRCGTQREAQLQEIRLHAFFNVKDHPLFFNQSNQTVTKFVTSGALSPEHKQKIREKALGRKHSPESKAKMSQGRRGKKRKSLSQEHRLHISLGVTRALQLREESEQRGHSLETRQKMSQTRQNKKFRHLEITKQKISETLRLRAEERRQKNTLWTCPWCGRVGEAPGIFVWHFSQCRFQPNRDTIEKKEK